MLERKPSKIRFLKPKKSNETCIKLPQRNIFINAVVMYYSRLHGQIAKTRQIYGKPCLLNWRRHGVTNKFRIQKGFKIRASWIHKKSII